MQSDTCHSWAIRHTIFSLISAAVHLLFTGIHIGCAFSPRVQYFDEKAHNTWTGVPSGHYVFNSYMVFCKKSSSYWSISNVFRIIGKLFEIVREWYSHSADILETFKIIQVLILTWAHKIFSGHIKFPSVCPLGTYRFFWMWICIYDEWPLIRSPSYLREFGHTKWEMWALIWCFDRHKIGPCLTVFLCAWHDDDKPVCD